MSQTISPKMIAKRIPNIMGMSHARRTAHPRHL
jgi:hypothetical protein